MVANPPIGRFASATSALNAHLSVVPWNRTWIGPCVRSTGYRELQGLGLRPCGLLWRPTSARPIWDAS